LFEAPVTSATATADATSNTISQLSVTSDPATTTATTISIVHACNISSTSSDERKQLCTSSIESSAASNLMLTAVHCVATTVVTNGDGSIPQLHKLVTDTPQCTVGSTEFVNVTTSTDSDGGQNEAFGATASSSNDIEPFTEETCSITEAEIPVVNKMMPLVDLSVPMVTSHDTADSSTIHISDLKQDLLPASNQFETKGIVCTNIILCACISASSVCTVVMHCLISQQSEIDYWPHFFQYQHQKY